MNSQIEDEEKFTKYFLFTLMTEKKLPTIFIPDASCYKIGSVIGKSSFAFSFIYASQFTKTGELVAVKKYYVESLSVREIKLIQKEICVVNHIRSPYVLSPLLSFVSGSEILSVLPLSEYGSCSDLIRNYFHGGLPEIIINFILKDVVKALGFIHMKGIIHRAIKASHILISCDGHAKLTGFRYAYKKNHDSNLFSRLKQIFEFPADSVSNLKWLSPDILQQNLNGYNEKSDIYSLGVAVCELANGVVPYNNSSLKSMIIEKVNGNIPDIYDSSTLDELSDILKEDFVSMKDFYMKKTFSKNLHSFKNLCCVLKPEERPDAEILKMHPLFTRIGNRKKLFSEHIFPAVPLTERNFLSYNSKLINSSIENFDNSEILFDWLF